MELNQERVKELFSYNGKNLIWKVRTSNRIQVGSVAGNYNHGYIEISIDNKSYYAHRLVWLYHYGYLPKEHLDHINGDTQDNRIENLRKIDKQGNARNCGMSCNNVSGVKGVYFNKQNQKWIANIFISGKTKYLGSYKNFDDAVHARYLEEVRLGWLGCNSPSNMGSAYSYLKRKLNHVL